MKKILPFLVFIPLLVFIISIGFTQFRKKENETKTMNENIVPTSVILPTNTISKKNISSNEINLIILSPESGSTIDGNTIGITGTTEPDAIVAINDSEITANKDGGFKKVISLDEGENYISIVAYNDLGNVSEREILVTRTTSGL